MADLSQRLFRLSAELGDLHLKRRALEAQRDSFNAELARGDFLIASKEHEIEVIRQLRAEEKAEADAAKNAPPTMPDVPERPCGPRTTPRPEDMVMDVHPIEGGPDAALPASVDAAADRSAALP